MPPRVRRPRRDRRRLQCSHLTIINPLMTLRAQCDALPGKHYTREMWWASHDRHVRDRSMMNTPAQLALKAHHPVVISGTPEPKPVPFSRSIHPILILLDCSVTRRGQSILWYAPALSLLVTHQPFGISHHRSGGRGIPYNAVLLPACCTPFCGFIVQSFWARCFLTTATPTAADRH